MILVISDSFDISTNEVIEWFYFYKIPFKRLNIQSFISGKYKISFNNSEMSLNIDGIDFIELKGVWYRRWLSFNQLKYGLDRYSDLSINEYSNVKYNFLES